MRKANTTLGFVMLGALLTLSGCGREELIIPAQENRATVGDVQVLAHSVGPSWSGGFLRIEMIVFTTNPKKNFQFVAWSVAGAPTLRDDVGNSYSPVQGEGKAAAEIDEAGWNQSEWAADHGFTKTPRMGWKNGEVNAGIIRRDVIYFQLPPPAAKKLTLDLPCKNIGSSGGLLRFVVDNPKPR